eukprot:8124049-Lingulodinium_polyedra.AAC.1
MASSTKPAAQPRATAARSMLRRGVAPPSRGGRALALQRSVPSARAFRLRAWSRPRRLAARLR